MKAKSNPMRRFYILLTIAASCFFHLSSNSQTYTLDWGTSFSPAWASENTSGSATNVGGSGRNITVTSGFTGTTTSWSAGFPQVNNNNGNASLLQVQNSTDAIQLQMNLPNRTSYATFTITFSAPVQNVSFAISDIDGPAAGTTFTYLDSVNITATGPGGSVNPTFAKYNSASTVLNIDGANAASANAASGANVTSSAQGSPAQDGTLMVSFTGNAITSITIVYATKNIPAVASDPGPEAIAIGNVKFSNAIAPTSANIINTILANGLPATAIPGITATDDESVSSITLATIPTTASGVLTYYNGSAWVAASAGSVLTTTQASSLRFNPPSSFSGNAGFTFFATDNRGLTSSTYTYTLPVEPTPPPTAMNILAPAEKNSYGPTSIPSLSAAVAAGTISSYTIHTIPANTEGILYLCNSSCSAVTAGQAVAPADIANLRFDPLESFTGRASFTYSATSNSGTSNTAVYSIPVNNEAPSANAILSQTIVNTAGATSLPALSGGDEDGTVVSFTIVTTPPASEGTLQLCNSTCSNVAAGQIIAIADGDKLRFTPVSSFAGNVRFNYLATDNNGNNSTHAAYTIPVKGTAAINTPPLSNNMVSSTLLNTSGATLLSPLSSTDLDGTIASYTIESIPAASQGTLSYCSNGTEPCTGSTTVLAASTSLTAAQMATLKFTPNTRFTGRASFTYLATDNNGSKSNTAIYSIPISSILPVANPVTAPVMSNTYGQTTIPALNGHNAAAISNYTITILPATASGTLYLCNSGCSPVAAGQVIALTDADKLSFDPAASFSGKATFHYTATDDLGKTSAAAPYTVPVTNGTVPAGVSPLAISKSNTSIANNGGAQSLSALSATDNDGTIASYTINALPAAQSGVLTLCNSGCVSVVAGQSIALTDIANLRFTPTVGYEGNALFEYTATDNSGKLSNTATFTIPVTAKSPVANNIQTAKLSTTAASTSIASLTGADADGSVVSYTVTSLPSSNAGILYLCNTVCNPVAAGQVVLASDAANLQFDPAAGYAGVFTQFNYIATDNAGKPSSQAIYSIPLSSGTPLPVHLLSFSGNKLDVTAVLSWTTESEENFLAYELERSSDASLFRTVITVAPQQGSGQKQYQYIDALAAISANKIYYRLKMIDKDGSFAYSRVISIDMPSKEFKVNIVNPVRSEISLSMQAAEKQVVRIVIADNTGRIVLNQQRTVEAGLSQITITESGNWSSGSYFMQVISTSGTTIANKLLIQH